VKLNALVRVRHSPLTSPINQLHVLVSYYYYYRRTNISRSAQSPLPSHPGPLAMSSLLSCGYFYAFFLSLACCEGEHLMGSLNGDSSTGTSFGYHAHPRCSIPDLYTNSPSTWVTLKPELHEGPTIEHERTLLVNMNNRRNPLEPKVIERLAPATTASQHRKKSPH